MKWSLRALLIPGLIAYLVVLGIVHTLVSDDIHIVFTGVGVGTLLLGVAALATVVIKAFTTTREYMAKTDELEHKLNGGLEAAARTHLQDNEVFESLIVRQDKLEGRIEEESKAKEECQSALSELRQWVIDRLDDAATGRKEAR